MMRPPRAGRAGRLWGEMSFFFPSSLPWCRAVREAARPRCCRGWGRMLRRVEVPGEAGSEGELGTRWAPSPLGAAPSPLLPQ